MSLPLYPIWIVDLLGSSLMILFSFLCVRVVRRLREQEQSNVVWIYLLWVCYVLAAFAVSRSVGHIAKRVFLTLGYEGIWNFLQPYSGAVNTLTFTVVASLTLFFEPIRAIYQETLKDKQSLEEAHEKLLYLNHHLEHLVEERTRELARSERKYRRIFEGSRDVIMVVSGDGTLLDLNPAGREMLGLSASPDGLENNRFQDFLAKDLPQSKSGNEDVWDFLKQSLQKQGYVADTELRLKHRDGSTFNALLSGTVEKRDHVGEDAQTVHFLIKDISRWKAMERQLLQADKLASIGQLAAGIAHEINNPLGIILGYTQLLLRSEEEDSQNYADLRIIEKHTRTCKTIVEDLLNFSRSTRTRKTLGHIHKAMEDILNVVHHHFKLDGIEIEKEFDPKMPPLTLDEEKMKQVFMNLLMNAKQAIGKKGTIRLKTRYDASENRIFIEVADTGSGIESGHLSRLFDPFFTTKATGEGTGLGLSVSYGIVKDHGGDILVESKPGKGATFTIVLPMLSQ